MTKCIVSRVWPNRNKCKLYHSQQSGQDNDFNKNHGDKFRRAGVWYGLLSESEDSKVPVNRPRAGEPLPATHARKNPTVGAMSSSAPPETIQPSKTKGIESLQVQGGKIVYLEGGVDEYTLDALLADETTCIVTGYRS